MKKREFKIVRPEIEIEYKGIRGLIYAIYAILRMGIKMVRCKVPIYIGDRKVISQIITLVAVPKYEIRKGA